jgi:hypothetical protein
MLNITGTYFTPGCLGIFVTSRAFSLQIGFTCAAIEAAGSNEINVFCDFVHADRI